MTTTHGQLPITEQKIEASLQHIGLPRFVVGCNNLSPCPVHDAHEKIRVYVLSENPQGTSNGPGKDLALESIQVDNKAEHADAFGVGTSNEAIDDAVVWIRFVDVEPSSI